MAQSPSPPRVSRSGTHSPSIGSTGEKERGRAGLCGVIWGRTPLSGPWFELTTTLLQGLPHALRAEGMPRAWASPRMRVSSVSRGLWP